MEFSNLGFDFSNLSTGTIKNKNQLVSIVLFIVAASIFPVFLVFSILYILGVPIDMNGVTTYPSDAAYVNFFTVFLSIFGILVFTFFFLFVLLRFKKPIDYIIIDRDTRNFDTLYYIYANHDEIYLTDKYFIRYSKKYNTTHHEVNPNEVKALKEKYLFWNNLIDLNDAKIKQRKNAIVVSKKVKQQYRGNMTRTYHKKYILSNQINVVPETVIESVSYYNRGNNSYDSRNKFYFENVNRAQHLTIHPDIKKVLHSLT